MPRAISHDQRCRRAQVGNDSCDGPASEESPAHRSDERGDAEEQYAEVCEVLVERRCPVDLVLGSSVEALVEEVVVWPQKGKKKTIDITTSTTAFPVARPAAGQSMRRSSAHSAMKTAAMPMSRKGG